MTIDEAHHTHRYDKNACWSPNDCTNVSFNIVKYNCTPLELHVIAVSVNKGT